MERRGEREYRLAVLNGRDPASGERPAVPDPVYEVDQRHGRVTRPDEVGVQRVHWPVFWHGAAGGDQRLTGHLPAEDPLPPLVLRAPAPEDVELDPLEIKQLDHGIKSLAHRARLLAIRPRAQGLLPHRTGTPVTPGNRSDPGDRCSVGRQARQGTSTASCSSGRPAPSPATRTRTAAPSPS